MPGRLSLEETVELLAAEYGLGDPDVGDQVHEATGGHLGLVRQYAQALVARGFTEGSLPPALTEPGGPIESYVDTLVDRRGQLAELCRLAPLSEALCAELGLSAYKELVEAGLVVRGAVVPAVAAGEPDPEIMRKAAQWYERHGLLPAAVRAYAHAGADDEWLRLTDQHGRALLAAGHGGLIADLLGRTQGSRSGSRSRQLLLGDAYRLTGQVLSASNAYSVVGDAETEWDAGLAWRMGLVHYLRGDSPAALKAFAQAPAESTSDGALLLAWSSVARLQLNEMSAAVEEAEAAVRLATAVGDDAALATAYVSLAMCQTMNGDPTELLTQALRMADRSGDVVLRARVLTNQTYQLLCEGRYGEALRAARLARVCATSAGHANLRSLALANEGDALAMLGRLDEATRQYERAIALCRRMGSRRSAAAQLGLGEVYRRRGWPEQARSAYEAAVRLAEEGGNTQVRVSALAGLSRVHPDPQSALTLAEQAVELAMSKVETIARVARGWTALRLADPAAQFWAEEATSRAREERDPAGLAEALELRAAIESDQRKVLQALREAHALWAAAGAEVEAARLRYRIGHLPGADTDARHGALIAADILTRAGVQLPDRPASTVVIRAFGRFEVVVGGDVVPASAWQSRKARDLLRILVSRRGRPAPRGELCELLWPDDDPVKTGHRLSVLLNIVRNALDPDRANPTDHYLVADQSSVGLDVTRLRIDVEEFLADSLHGRRLHDRGATTEARILLEAAESAYTAEVFADEPYAEWSVPLREEARAAYIGTLRLLARLSKEHSAGYLIRLLNLDPYDETGHQALIEALVAGGQHGEARRAVARYQQAMREIGVRPSVQYQEPMKVP